MRYINAQENMSSEHTCEQGWRKPCCAEANMIIIVPAADQPIRCTIRPAHITLPQGHHKLQHAAQAKPALGTQQPHSSTTTWYTWACCWRQARQDTAGQLIKPANMRTL
jgi:hypothetical protein